MERGCLVYIFSGEHSFIFQESETTPGGTTFINKENFKRFNLLFMRLMPAEKMFYQFCADFKKKVESVKKGAASTST